VRHDFEMLRAFDAPASMNCRIRLRGGMESLLPKPAVNVNRETAGPSGQELAGKGELVFEGEVLEMPTWR